MRDFNRNPRPVIIDNEQDLFDISLCCCLQKGGRTCSCLKGEVPKEDPGWSRESMDFYLDQLSERRLTIWKVQYRKKFEIAMTADGDGDVSDEGDFEVPDTDPCQDPMNEDAISVVDQQEVESGYGYDSLTRSSLYDNDNLNDLDWDPTEHTNIPESEGGWTTKYGKKGNRREEEHPHPRKHQRRHEPNPDTPHSPGGLHQCLPGGPGPTR